MEEIIKHITKTVEGYPVKELRWKPLDNIIRGKVLCPIWSKENVNEGYTTVCWRKNGTLTQRYGGNTRKDLYLDMTTYEKVSS